MAIRIQTEKPEIKVDFAGVPFVYSYRDDDVVAEDKIINEIASEISNIKPEDEKDLEKTKEILRRAYDTVLGDGAFEKIYPIFESCHLLSIKFFELKKSLEEELEAKGIEILNSNSNTKKQERYLQNKKRKNGNYKRR